MKATWERLEKNWVQLQVEVEAERLGKAVDQAFRKLVKKVNIPGFRRGKAPRFIFEQVYGKESLVQEALESLVPEAYDEAVDTTGVEPVDHPELDLVSVDETEGLVFKAKVQVKPEVQLGRLSEFENLQMAEGSIDAAEVERELEVLREQHASLEPYEEPAAEGHFLLIDFQGFVDGEPFAGGSGEAVNVQIGAGRFISGFEEGLVGARADEEREVKVTFPEDYPAPELQGKEAVFKVKVLEVKHKVLPDLNDAFAAEVSRFQTLQELRSDIENRLKDNAAMKAQQDFKQQVVDAVAGDAQVDIPQPMVERQLDHMLHEFQHTLSQQGLELEQYLQLSGKTIEQVREDLKETAAKRVRTDLVLEAVSKSKDISVTDEEIEAEIEKTAQEYGDNAAEVRRMMAQAANRERLREGLVRQKTIDYLVQLNQDAPAEPRQEES